MARSHVRVVPLTTVCLCFGLLGACKSKPDDSPPATSGEEASSSPAINPDDAPPTDDALAQPGTAEFDDPRAVAVEVAKSSAAASTGGKGVKNLGFNLEKISHLFALKATAKLPSWGASGEGEPTLTRDDDLDTAWRCELGQANPCVLALALPEKAKLEVVRLYGAAGPNYRDYKGNPRVAKVRIHTDAGYVDAELPDGANHAYVRFDAPIESQSLAIEVLDVHAGDKSKLVHIADVEIYGTDGVPRAPMTLDPEQAWASWETTQWSDADAGGEHTIRQVFLYALGPAAAAGEAPAKHRLARATAVYGLAGDDYALFERLNGTSCEDVDGGYVLFDKRSRMHYPVNDLGGAGAQVYRHTAGHGFAVGWMNDDGQFTIKGVVEEGGVLKWKRPPKDGVEDGKALLSSWGFDPDPLPRGVPLGGAVAGCHRGATGELDAISGVAKLDGAPLDPAQWMVCSVGGDTLFASASCDAKPRAYQLDGAGKLVDKFEGKQADARGLRLRRVGDRLFVELSTERGDSASLFLAEPGALHQLERNGGLYVRPPSSCEPCTDEWLNPEGTIAEGEALGDEGDQVEEPIEDEEPEDEEPLDDEEPVEDEASQNDERPAAPPNPTLPG